MNSLHEILQSFIRVRGVRAALVAGLDGLVLEAAHSNDGPPVETDAIGAVAASGLVPANEFGEQTGHGAVRQAIFEYEDGVVVIEMIGENAVLVVVTSISANLGLLRLQARKAHPDLAASMAGL